MTDKARDRGQTTYLLEAANGMLVRVPADKLGAWRKAQDEVRAGRFKPDQRLSQQIAAALKQRGGR